MFGQYPPGGGYPGAAGVAAISGDVAFTGSAASLSVTAVETFTGTVALTGSAASLSVVGVYKINYAHPFGVGYDDQAWDGAVWDATRTADVSLSAVAFTGIEGTVSLTSAAASLSLTASETFTGTASLSGVAASLSATATETFSATTALTSAAASLASTGTTFGGTVALTGAAAALAATAAETFSATGNWTSSAAALAAAGTETFAGTGAWTSAAAAFAAAGGEQFVDDVQFVSAPSSLTASGVQTFTGTAALEGTASLAASGLALNPIFATAAVTMAPASIHAKVRRRLYSAGAEVLDLGGYSAFVNEHQPPEIQELPTYHEPEFTPEQGPASVFVPPTPYVAPLSTLTSLFGLEGTGPAARAPGGFTTAGVPTVAPEVQQAFGAHAARQSVAAVGSQWQGRPAATLAPQQQAAFAPVTRRPATPLSPAWAGTPARKAPLNLEAWAHPVKK